MVLFASMQDPTTPPEPAPDPTPAPPPTAGAAPSAGGAPDPAATPTGAPPAEQRAPTEPAGAAPAGAVEPAGDPLDELSIEELDEGFCAAAARMRAAQLACAAHLRALAERGGFHALGAGGVETYAERRAVSADEALVLLGCATAIVAEPTVESHVREGRIPVAAAACVGEALSNSALQRPGDDWIGWAQTLSTRALRRLLRRRKEEARAQGEPVVPLTLLVTTKVRDDFDRARTVASRKASKALTSGETLGVIASFYLDACDPARVEPAARRMGSTDDIPGRSIPVEERRKIHARQGERCAVPFCGREIFLQVAHVIPHAYRGNREASNLLLLCGQHHQAFDEGLIRLVGTAEKPEFVDAQGRSLGRRLGAAPPVTGEPVPRRLPQVQKRRPAKERPPKPKPGEPGGPAPP